MLCRFSVGLLHPLSPTLVQFLPQEIVTLQVNITPTATFTRDYLRALTWYHNGVEIVPASSGTISLSSDNTTLTIPNTSSSHSGVYEVQFAGLRIYPHYSFCDQEALALLQHYPLLSTVSFYVYSNGGKWSHHHRCIVTSSFHISVSCLNAVVIICITSSY